MSKVIAAINMTLDGFCDHTAIDPDEALHTHYSDLLRAGGSILYGRITYQLMEFWPTVLQNPTGTKSMDEFAEVMDKIPKIVFSRTLTSVSWETARLATKDIQAEIEELTQQSDKDILVGSRSLIINLLNLNLLDELQLCIHPVIAGQGLPLFENVEDRKQLTLFKIKRFDNSGAVIHYYKPKKD